MAFARAVAFDISGSGPRAKSLAWTSKISENRCARTSLIWAGENETLKRNGALAFGTLSSATEKREFALQIGGLEQPRPLKIFGGARTLRALAGCSATPRGPRGVLGGPLC